MRPSTLPRPVLIVPSKVPLPVRSRVGRTARLAQRCLSSHLDIDDAVAADQRSRNVVIRRLRRALDVGPQSLSS